MVLVIYDLLGTLVLEDCQVVQSFAPRKGALDVLRAQRRLGWASALFADDERKLVEEVLLKSGLAGAFTEIHTGEEFDDEGLKNLSTLSKRDYWVVFIGDMTRDLRAAKKYGVSFIKVPPFTSRDEGFDFGVVRELLEAVIFERFKEFKDKYRLEKAYETPEFIDFAGEHVRIRVYLDRFEAQFY
jgi:hypothetical protein